MGEINQLEESSRKRSLNCNSRGQMAEYYNKMVEEKENKLKCYEQKMQESLNQIEVLKKAVSRENEFKLKADELQRQLNEMKNLTEEHELCKNQFTHPVGRELVQQNKENTDELIALEEQIKRLEKTNIDLQKDSEYKADHLRQNNKQLQKRFLNLQDKHANLRQQYDKMKHRMHVKTDGLLTSKRDKGLLSDNDVEADRDVRVTQLKGELNEKTKEQEEMRSLIRWLKKDLYKANNDLIQLKKENSELVRSKDKLERELQQWIHKASSMRKNDVHAMHRAMQLKEAERVKTHAKMNFIQMKKKNMWNEQERKVTGDRHGEGGRIQKD
ncbi:hypothetical protein BSL78_15264 [Apostichopus japonicus]|uniref:Uncharacterized protein n=1 Tax=Stichopus japonicus TaxID=307972 RepID=A0A2G8KIR2_STIJA|nr:hypothetical protein BSL78_15264 [Apostichopus japonicus]